MNETQSADRDESFRMEAAGDWLLRLGEREVSEETVGEWIEWCESDVRNLQIFEEMQSLWLAAAAHPPSATQRAELLGRHDSATSTLLKRPRDRAQLPHARGGWGRNLRWLTMVASLTAIVALAIMLSPKIKAPDSNGETVRNSLSSDSISTPLAKNQVALLPDGSRVDLGARSALDVEFNQSERRLELRSGQAFFRVKHDSIHPFVVQAGPVKVVAVGTAFDVRKSEGTVVVTVLEGTVEVTNRRETNAVAVRGTAGYQMLIDDSSGRTRLSIVDPQMATAWRSGRLEFAGDSLATVIASVNRYSPVPVVLEDPGLGNLKFTGTVFVDAIGASLDAMQQVFPLEVHRSANEILLSGRKP